MDKTIADPINNSLFSLIKENFKVIIIQTIFQIE